jgi:hypothetical protein
MKSPTLSIYSAFQEAFDHFNGHLFGNRLPACLLTLRSGRHTLGYMHKRRFVNLDGTQVDELAMNPAYFALRSTEEVLGTLVHEMVHHWQNHFGLRQTATAHNREWAAKMRSLGLMPSDSGLPGGKQTGQRVSHFILPDGPFVQASLALCQTGWTVPWLDTRLSMAPEKMREFRTLLAQSGEALVSSEPPIAIAQARGITLGLMPPLASETSSRMRYVCPQCNVRAWAAPETALECGDCKLTLAVITP